MRPKTSFKALLLQEDILRFELSWTAVSYRQKNIKVSKDFFDTEYRTIDEKTYENITLKAGSMIYMIHLWK